MEYGGKFIQLHIQNCLRQLVNYEFPITELRLKDFLCNFYKEMFTLLFGKLEYLLN